MCRSPAIAASTPTTWGSRTGGTPTGPTWDSPALACLLAILPGTASKAPPLPVASEGGIAEVNNRCFVPWFVVGRMLGCECIGGGGGILPVD
jgi:hypothetical protein